MPFRPRHYRNLHPRCVSCPFTSSITYLHRLKVSSKGVYTEKSLKPVAKPRKSRSRDAPVPLPIPRGASSHCLAFICANPEGEEPLIPMSPNRDAISPSSPRPSRHSHLSSDDEQPLPSRRPRPRPSLLVSDDDQPLSNRRSRSLLAISDDDQEEVNDDDGQQDDYEGRQDDYEYQYGNDAQQNDDYDSNNYSAAYPTPHDNEYDRRHHPATPPPHFRPASPLPHPRRNPADDYDSNNDNVPRPDRNPVVIRPDRRRDLTNGQDQPRKKARTTPALPKVEAGFVGGQPPKGKTNISHLTEPAASIIPEAQHAFEMLIFTKHAYPDDLRVERWAMKTLAAAGAKRSVSLSATDRLLGMVCVPFCRAQLADAATCRLSLTAGTGAATSAPWFASFSTRIIALSPAVRPLMSPRTCKCTRIS